MTQQEYIRTEALGRYPETGITAPMQLLKQGAFIAGAEWADAIGFGHWTRTNNKVGVTTEQLYEEYLKTK